MNNKPEKTFVEINGLRQGMFIKSQEIGSPVLLFLHGGPGMPEYWLNQHHPAGLEKLFTVAWWDQRGAGLSYSPHIPPESMTAEQFIRDVLEVTNYLRKRFGQEKIYLLAHSWGSYIGIQAAAQAPELFHAYIGMGQISHQIQSERLAYEYALDFFQTTGQDDLAKKLKAAPPTDTVPLPDEYENLRDEYMHAAGIGTTHAMKSVITGLFIPTWFFPEYTFREKVNLWRGKFYSKSKKFSLWDKMQITDLSQTVNALSLPTYFLEGRFDYTCAYPLAKDYFRKIIAPVKGFYTFENSAHSPMFEEPEKFRRVLHEDVLTGKIGLADEM